MNLKSDSSDSALDAKFTKFLPLSWFLIERVLVFVFIRNQRVHQANPSGRFWVMSSLRKPIRRDLLPRNNLVKRRREEAGRARKRKTAEGAVQWVFELERSKRKRLADREERWSRWIERDRHTAERESTAHPGLSPGMLRETLSATSLLITTYQSQPEQSFLPVLFLRLPNLA